MKRKSRRILTLVSKLSIVVTSPRIKYQTVENNFINELLLNPVVLFFAIQVNLDTCSHVLSSNSIYNYSAIVALCIAIDQEINDTVLYHGNFLEFIIIFPENHCQL